MYFMCVLASEITGSDLNKFSQTLISEITGSKSKKFSQKLISQRLHIQIQNPKALISQLYTIYILRVKPRQKYIKKNINDSDASMYHRSYGTCKPRYLTSMITARKGTKFTAKVPWYWWKISRWRHSCTVETRFSNLVINSSSKLLDTLYLGDKMRSLTKLLKITTKRIELVSWLL